MSKQDQSEQLAVQFARYTSTKNEREISLRFWGGWLYKRLLILEHMTIGISELPVGGVQDHYHINEHVLHYVIDGRGSVTLNEDQPDQRIESFDAGKLFDFPARQRYFFNCDSPTLLLTVRTPVDASPCLEMHTLQPDAHFNRYMLPRTAYTNECGFLFSGEVSLNAGGIAQTLTGVTVFYVLPELEYTLHNQGTTTLQWATITASAGSHRDRTQSSTD